MTFFPTKSVVVNVHVVLGDIVRHSKCLIFVSSKMPNEEVLMQDFVFECVWEVPHIRASDFLFAFCALPVFCLLSKTS